MTTHTGSLSEGSQRRGRVGLRAVAVTLAFGVLAVLEVASGFDQLARIRAEHGRELLELVDRQQEILSRRVADLMGDGARHAAHLAQTPGVHALLGEQREEERAELVRWLLPYLANFEELDRLSLLDRDGRERMCLERMGGGVAVLPAGLLRQERDPLLERLAARSVGGQVVMSPLLYDAERVEVSDSDRRVFQLVCSVEEASVRMGSIAVTIYAAPLLRALADFEPLPGSTSCLLDLEGRLVAPTLVEDGITAQLETDPLLGRQLVEAEDHTRRAGTTYIVRRTSVVPPALLVTSIPEAQLRAELSLSERVRAIGRTLLVLGGIALGSAFVVRAGQRSARSKEAERHAARVREESGKHRALMEAAADIILIVDLEAGRLTDWNPRARGTLVPADDQGPHALRTLSAAFGDEGLAALTAAIHAAAERPGSAHVVTGLNVAALDGAALILEARCVGLEYGGRSMVEVALSDRTRERESEQRARTAERLSAVGLLTAGVAHEINNPLEGIGNYLALLERPGLEPDMRSAYLAQVRRGFERIREITSQLLRFARTDDAAGREERADLSLVVQRAVEMTALSGHLKDVRVECEGVEEPVFVTGSPGRIEQILLNLLLNAGRAMQGTGRVGMRVVREADGVVALHVDDSGPGVDPADLGRLFDPFFSRSAGTGLGLSVSYGIARALGGELSAANRIEGGARFTLRLHMHSEGDQ